MRKNNGYDVNFSRVYRILAELSGIDYDAVFDNYLLLIRGFSPTETVIADIACGTGEISVRFASLGYKVIASDISDGMLYEAEETAAAIRRTLARMPFFPPELPERTQRILRGGMKNISFCRQDMRTLQLSEKADIVTSVFDGINHLNSIKDIDKTFAAVFSSLKSGGAFVFDVNTVKKHAQILADNVFIFEEDNIYTAWRNETKNGKNYAKTDYIIDIFMRFSPLADSPEFLSILPPDSYFRETVIFSETAYYLERLKGLLEKNGFRDIHVYDFSDISKKGTEFSDKVIFYAVKD